MKFAVLVISLLLVALSSSTQARIKRSRKLPKMVCTTKQNAFQRRRLTNEIITSNDVSNSLDREGKKYNVENEINYESSYWLRNACHNGFVVIKENKRVLAQHQGLTQYNEEGKNILNVPTLLNNVFLSKKSHSFDRFMSIINFIIYFS